MNTLRSILVRLRDHLDAHPRQAVSLAAIPITIAVIGLVVEVVLFDSAGRLGIDYRQYMAATDRFLSGGSFYQPWQLTGPYPVPDIETNIDLLPVLYPPYTLALFIPGAILGPLFWWGVPAAILTWHVVACRPRPWAWPLLGVTGAYWFTVWLVLSGNPVMWATAAVAGAIRYGWPGAYVLLKPTLAPFALIGIHSRGWWAALSTLLIASVATWSLWPDFVTAVMNAQRRAGVLYSLNDVPMMLIPIIAWVARSSRTQQVTGRAVSISSPLPPP